MVAHHPWPCDPALWLQAEPLLQAALSDDDTMADAVDEMRRRCSQLWLAVDDGRVTSAAVTRRCGDRIEFWLTGSTDGTAALAGFAAGIADAAKADGCRSAWLSGRVGWRRVFPDWRVTAVTLERAL